jgi:hypothetical protein
MQIQENDLLSWSAEFVPGVLSRGPTTIGEQSKMRSMNYIDVGAPPLISLERVFSPRPLQHAVTTTAIPVDISSVPPVTVVMICGRKHEDEEGISSRGDDDDDALVNMPRYPMSAVVAVSIHANAVNNRMRIRAMLCCMWLNAWINLGGYSACLFYGVYLTKHSGTVMDYITATIVSLAVTVFALGSIVIWICKSANVSDQERWTLLWHALSLSLNLSMLCLFELYDHTESHSAASASVVFNVYATVNVFVGIITCMPAVYNR